MLHTTVSSTAKQHFCPTAPHRRWATPVAAMAAVAMAAAVGSSWLQSYRTEKNDRMAVSGHLCRNPEIQPGTTVTIPNRYNNAHTKAEVLAPVDGQPRFSVNGKTMTGWKCE